MAPSTVLVVYVDVDTRRARHPVHAVEALERREPRPGAERDSG
jgi:hypothetical protein